MNFKPYGYSTVSPYLIVTDAEATIRFMEALLGVKEIRRIADDSGRLMYVDVRLTAIIFALKISCYADRFFCDRKPRIAPGSSESVCDG